MTSGIAAEDIVRLFEEDVRVRKRLAELLVSEPNVGLAIVNAVLREVAAKQDVREVIKELREYVRDHVDAKVGGIERRIEGIEKRLEELCGEIRELRNRIW